jgi:hypothetical protein
MGDHKRINRLETSDAAVIVILGRKTSPHLRRRLFDLMRQAGYAEPPKSDFRPKLHGLTYAVNIGSNKRGGKWCFATRRKHIVKQYWGDRCSVRDVIDWLIVETKKATP